MTNKSTAPYRSSNTFGYAGKVEIVWNMQFVFLSIMVIQSQLIINNKLNNFL